MVWRIAHEGRGETEKILILEHHWVGGGGGGLPKYERENFINNHRRLYA